MQKVGKGVLGMWVVELDPRTIFCMVQCELLFAKIPRFSKLKLHASGRVFTGIIN